MRILLTGARAPVTLDLARHFHRAGHTVFLADSIRMPLARWTRAATRTLRVASPALDTDRFVNDLLAIVKRFQIEMVIPTCEEVFYIASQAEAIQRQTPLFAEPLHRLKLLHDKWDFVQLVDQLHGAAIAPDSYRLVDANALQAFCENRDTTQWVFKPIYSRFAARTRIGPTRTSALEIQPHSSDPWIVQRRIVGQEYSTYSVVRNGTVRAHACYRSEYRAGPGSGIYFVPHFDDRIEKFTEQIAQQFHFTGQIGFDLIDGQDGLLYVLECNPRATSGLHLFQDQSIVDAFLQDEGPRITPPNRCPTMLASIMALYAIPIASRGGGFAQLFRDMRRARDAIFAWNDPLPTLLAPLSLVEVLATAIRVRKPLTHAATFDIEWNGGPI